MQIKQFKQINWHQCQVTLRQTQEKLIKAYNAKDSTMVSKIQKQIVTSFEARAIAVKRVTQNKRIPGIDEETWTTDSDKIQAIETLHYWTQNPEKYVVKPYKKVSNHNFLTHKSKKRGYTFAFRRKVETKTKKKDSITIPTILDRAMQAVYFEAIHPLVEEQTDFYNYGFSSYNSKKDAIRRLSYIYEPRDCPSWILDTTIECCQTNHEWLLKNTPIMDKTILQYWLKAGIMNKPEFEPTDQCCSAYWINRKQGGVIAPLLCHFIFNGIENHIKTNYIKTFSEQQLPGAKINFIRYADRFLMTGKHMCDLHAAKLSIIEFLQTRGLTLNDNKTWCLDVKESPINFLGFWMVKEKSWNTKTHIYGKKGNIGYRYFHELSKETTSQFKRDIKILLKRRTNNTIKQIIDLLNKKLIKWADYYRIAKYSQRAFKPLSNYLNYRMFQWAKKKHKKRNNKSLLQQYTTKSPWRTYHWYDKQSKTYLIDISAIKYKPIPVLKKGLNPYKEKHRELIDQRALQIALESLDHPFCQPLTIPNFNLIQDKTVKAKQTNKSQSIFTIGKYLLKKQKGLCPVCGFGLFEDQQDIQFYHLTTQNKMHNRNKNKNKNLENLALLHKQCHFSVNQNQEQFQQLLHFLNPLLFEATKAKTIS